MPSVDGRVGRWVCGIVQMIGRGSCFDSVVLLHCLEIRRLRQSTLGRKGSRHVGDQVLLGLVKNETRSEVNSPGSDTVQQPKNKGRDGYDAHLDTKDLLDVPQQLVDVRSRIGEC